MLQRAREAERGRISLGPSSRHASACPAAQRSREARSDKHGRLGRRLAPARPLGDVAPLWANVTHAAGLTITPHGLRHSFITVARALGSGDHVIAGLVGHSLGSMTSRYGLAPGDIVREAADKVSATIAARLATPSAVDANIN